MTIFEAGPILISAPEIKAISSSTSKSVYFNQDASSLYDQDDKVVELNPDILAINDFDIPDVQTDFMVAFDAWQNRGFIIYSKRAVEDEIPYQIYRPSNKDINIEPMQITSMKWFIRYYEK